MRRIDLTMTMGSVNTLQSRTILTVLLAMMLTALLSASCGCDAVKEPPAQLSVAEAVSMALGENIHLKQQESSYKDALSGLRTSRIKTTLGWGTDARVNRYPSESDASGVVFGDMTYKSLGGTEATVDFTPLGLGTERGAFGVTLRHPLMRGSGELSSRADRLASAVSSVSVQEKQLFLTRQAKVMEVVRSYYQAVLARDQVVVQEAAVATAEESLRAARIRVREGIVAGIERERADLQVQRAREQLNRANQSARDAIDRLMVAIGSGVGHTPELTDSVPDADLKAVPDVATAIETALEKRGELFTMDRQISDQERRFALASDELRPSLYAVAGYSSSNADVGLVTGSALEFGNLMAGFELRFPTDRRTLSENRDNVKRDLDVLRQLRIYRMEEIAEDVRQAHRAVERAQRSLTILTDSLEISKKELYAANRRVEVGESSNRDVLDAQNSVTDAETGLLSAKLDLYLATLDLEYSMGEDLTKIGF